jgi:hypothetical protein
MSGKFLQGLGCNRSFSKGCLCKNVNIKIICNI